MTAAEMRRAILRPLAYRAEDVGVARGVNEEPRKVALFAGDIGH
jgi:hypothetical protein